MVAEIVAGAERGKGSSAPREGFARRVDANRLTSGVTAAKLGLGKFNSTLPVDHRRSTLTEVPYAHPEVCTHDQRLSDL